MRVTSSTRSLLPGVMCEWQPVDTWNSLHSRLYDHPFVALHNYSDPKAMKKHRKPVMFERW